jgi:hypothetical protein
MASINWIPPAPGVQYRREVVSFAAPGVDTRWSDHPDSSIFLAICGAVSGGKSVASAEQAVDLEGLKRWKNG